MIKQIIHFLSCQEVYQKPDPNQLIKNITANKLHFSNYFHFFEQHKKNTFYMTPSNIICTATSSVNIIWQKSSCSCTYNWN
jgi:hypothetical protein